MYLPLYKLLCSNPPVHFSCSCYLTVTLLFLFIIFCNCIALINLKVLTSLLLLLFLMCHNCIGFYKDNIVRMLKPARKDFLRIEEMFTLPFRNTTRILYSADDYPY
jgi:hypothetical protein